MAVRTSWYSSLLKWQLSWCQNPQIPIFADQNQGSRPSFIAQIAGCYGSTMWKTPILMILIPIFGTSKYLQLWLNKIHTSSFVTKNIKKHQSSLNFTTIYTESKASGFWNPLLQRRKSTENRRKIHGWPSNNSSSAPFWALPSTARQVFQGPATRPPRPPTPFQDLSSWCYE